MNRRTRSSDPPPKPKARLDDEAAAPPTPTRQTQPTESRTNEQQRASSAVHLDGAAASASAASSPAASGGARKSPCGSSPDLPRRTRAQTAPADAATGQSRPLSRNRSPLTASTPTSPTPTTRRKSSRKRIRSEDEARTSKASANSDEDDSDDSPFYPNSHVRFSPSAKNGSPAGARARDRSRELRARSRMQQEPLHNLTSEDEQSEFNRRYSRDLRRSRRQKERGGAPPNYANDSTSDGDCLTPSPRRHGRRRRCRVFAGDADDDDEEEPRQPPPKLPPSVVDPSSPPSSPSSSARRLRKRSSSAGTAGPSCADAADADGTDDDDDDGIMAAEDDDDNTQDMSRPRPRRVEEQEEVSSPTRVTRRSEARKEADDDDGGVDVETPQSPATAVRRSRRRPDVSRSEAEEPAEEQMSRRWSLRPRRQTSALDDTEDESLARSRSSRRLQQRQENSEGEGEEEEEVEEEEDEDEEQEEEEDDKTTKAPGSRRSSRRSSRPVERLTYERKTASRRRTEELRNLDQYSTDDEYQADPSRGRRKYQLRENRAKVTRFEEEYSGKNNACDEDSASPRKYKKSLTKGPHKEARERRGGRARDTSSSSSSGGAESGDEKRFEKRKQKRMNIERAQLMPLNLDRNELTKAIFRDRQKVGSSLADVSPMEMDMGVSFEDVGGVADHVDALKEMVMFPLLYPEIFQKFHVTPPRGVLFFGPPGTGKTLIARALACECSRDGKKVAFFMRKGADCLSKWIGESERQLRLLFDQAYLMRPSIIFFDEIDGLAPVRSSRQDQIHSSIVSTLLALMDGLDNRGEIIVIGATNRIENIDPALRRPGRFDRELRFALPTRDARKDILTLHTRKWRPEIGASLLDLLADRSIGYCGADLKGLCAEAALNALRRRYPQVYKSSQKLALDLDEINVVETDFFRAMQRMVPSTHRIQDQYQSPLPLNIRPLLQATFLNICHEIERVLPRGVGRYQQQPRAGPAAADAAAGPTFRPRLLIAGDAGQGQITYLAPALLHHLEKLPCQKLDIPALYSNASRSPEEACAQILHEARKTLPGVLYMPHVEKLWGTLTETTKATLTALLSDVQPNAPLLILMIAEAPHAHLPDEVKQLFSKAYKEVYTLEMSNEAERREFFKPIFDAAVQMPAAAAAGSAAGEDEPPLPVLPVKQARELTEREENRLRKKEDKLLRELRIFLRDIWTKLNREQKFFMFRVPVSDDADDYADVIEQPMDFAKMLCKLDDGDYLSAQDFLDDIDLIAENTVTYNSDLNFETNRVLVHRARALQDFCYALVKAEMDSDFEDECRNIVERREKLTKQREDEERRDPEAAATSDVAAAAAASGPETTGDADSTMSPRPKKKKTKKSRWARGIAPPKKKKKIEFDDDDDDDDDGGDDDGCDDGDPGASGREAAAILSAEAAADVPLLSRHERRDDGDDGDDGGQQQREAENTDLEPTAASSSVLVPTGVRLDQTKLGALYTELVRTTEAYTVERLERSYVTLDEIVRRYAEAADRQQLTSDMQVYLDNLKTMRFPSVRN